MTRRMVSSLWRGVRGQPMDMTKNTWRGRGLPEGILDGVPFASDCADLAEEVVSTHLIAGQTPLVLAEGMGCETWVKDERGRIARSRAGLAF